MSTTALLLLAFAATALGLLALAFWWFRRNNLAVYPVGRAPRQLRPLPTGCELGAQLMAATQAPTRPGGGPASGGAPTSAPTRPQRRKPSGPSRRAFLRNAMGVGWLGVLAGFGGATLAFLWPPLREGFGAEIDVDDEDAILEHIRTTRQPYEFPAGRMYIVEYDPAHDPDGNYAELTNGARVMALYHVCVHLGCKVPWCLTSQWFECPCHGSRYNRWGEWRGGPAPRGLDRFALTVEDSRVIVDTSAIITGPSRQALTLDQPPEGPSCL